MGELVGSSSCLVCFPGLFERPMEGRTICDADTKRPAGVEFSAAPASKSSPRYAVRYVYESVDVPIGHSLRSRRAASVRDTDLLASYTDSDVVGHRGSDR